MKEHRAPWECVYAKEDKSKCKSGKKLKSDQEYFEILCILQAGLSWNIIRKNWRKYKKGFYNFDINKLVKVKPTKLNKNSNVIRNIKKIESIIHNAKEFQKMKKEYGSFHNFICSLRKMRIKEVFESLTKKFKHFGIYSAEYYLHSVGYL